MKAMMILFIIQATLSRVTVIDKNHILDQQNKVQNTEQICRQLKSKDLKNVKIVYLSTEQQKLVKQIHKEDFFARFSDVKKFDISYQNQSSKKMFLKCLRNLESLQLDITTFNEDINLYDVKKNQKLLLFVDNDPRKSFMFSERILEGETKVQQEQSQLTDKTKNNINLYPNGLFGVTLIIVFLLVVSLTFVMILNTGDFNPKFVKERMPLGREY